MSAPRGFVLCGTGLRPGQLADVKRLVVALGGGAVYNGNLTTATTHLLVQGPVNTDKYRTVVSGAAGVVTLVDPEWVVASGASGAWLPAEAFAVPPLRGLTVSSTGLDDATREALQEAVEGAGGIFAPLSQATTHLLAREARGDKHGLAVQYGERG
jgi:hypothetical protein